MHRLLSGRQSYRLRIIKYLCDWTVLTTTRVIHEKNETFLFTIFNIRGQNLTELVIVVVSVAKQTIKRKVIDSKRGY